MYNINFSKRSFLFVIYCYYFYFIFWVVECVSEMFTQKKDHIFNYISSNVKILQIV